MRVPFFSRMSAVEVHENVVLILGGDSSMDATVSKSNDVFFKVFFTMFKLSSAL